MKFEIVKLEQISGSRVTFYSVFIDDESTTLFERFISENVEAYGQELANLKNQILAIANRTGIRDNFFDKPEGKVGQDIWALYDKPGAKLRLYCMQLGHVVVILGGGGPKTTRTLQEDPKLEYENELMRMVSDALTERIREKEILWSSDGMELEGDFIFDDNLEED